MAITGRYIYLTLRLKVDEAGLCLTVANDSCVGAVHHECNRFQKKMGASANEGNSVNQQQRVSSDTSVCYNPLCLYGFGRVNWFVAFSFLGLKAIM